MATKQQVVNKQKTQPTKSSDKVRVQFDFSEQSLEKLDELVKAVNATTRADVIRRALIFYTEIIKAEQRSAKIILEEPNGEKTRLMPLI